MNNSDNASWVDSHCHLDFDTFDQDRAEVIERARRNGARALLTIGTHVHSIATIQPILETYAWIYGTVGLHPHEIQSSQQNWMHDFTHIQKQARHDKIIGIGETGLDFVQADEVVMENQRQCFDAHIQLAIEKNKPIIVHTREAEKDTNESINRGVQQGLKGVIHCFTGSLEFAQNMLDCGFYISISGIVTFKNAKNLQNIVRQLPLSRILIETDSPYLAPMPHRGQRNEPSFVCHTAAYLADLYQMTTQDVYRQTTENFFNLFFNTQA